jgi:hypothetical protein
MPRVEIVVRKASKRDKEKPSTSGAAQQNPLQQQQQQYHHPVVFPQVRPCARPVVLIQDNDGRLREVARAALGIGVPLPVPASACPTDAEKEKPSKREQTDDERDNEDDDDNEEHVIKFGFKGRMVSGSATLDEVRASGQYLLLRDEHVRQMSVDRTLFCYSVVLKM